MDNITIEEFTVNVDGFGDNTLNCTLKEFIIQNDDLLIDDIDTIIQMNVGETVYIGMCEVTRTK